MTLEHPDRYSDRGLLLHIIDRLDNLETRMADLDPALDRLDASVARIETLVGTDLPALREALDAERAANAELVQLASDTAAAEDAEDVTQNEDLARVTAERDAAVAETDAALSRIEGAASDLDSVGSEGEQPV